MNPYAPAPPGFVTRIVWQFNGYLMTCAVQWSVS